jgi:hypothetical protein
MKIIESALHGVLLKSRFLDFARNDSLGTIKFSEGEKGSVRTYRHFGVDKGPMGRVKG